MSQILTAKTKKMSHAALQKYPVLLRKSDNEKVGVTDFLATNSSITTYHIQSVDQFGTNEGPWLTFAQVQAEYVLSRP